MHFNAFDYIPFGAATLWVFVAYLLDRARSRRGDDSAGR